MTDKRKIAETPFTKAARSYLDACRQAGAANWRQKVDAAAAKLHELSQDLVNRLPELLEHEGEAKVAETWKRLAITCSDVMTASISRYAVHCILPRPRHNLLEIAARIRRAGSTIAAAADEAGALIHLYEKGGPLARERAAIDQNLAADGHEAAAALAGLEAWATRLETAHRKMGPATGRTHIERHLGRPVERLAAAVAEIWPNDSPPFLYEFQNGIDVIAREVCGARSAPRGTASRALKAKIAKDRGQK